MASETVGSGAGGGIEGEVREVLDAAVAARAI